MAASARRPAAPARVRLYVAAVTVAALLSLPLTWLAPGSTRGVGAALDTLMLVALIAAAHRRPVHIGPRRKVNAGTAAEVAAVLVLPGPLAVLTLAVGAVAGEARVRAAPVQRLFNAATAVLRATLGAAVYAAVSRLGPHPLAEPAAALAAATVMYAGTTLLVIGVAAVQLRESPLRLARLPQREMVLADAALSLAGIVAAFAAADHAWTLPLLVAPAAIAHRALRDSVALQAQTRLALEELADIVDLRDHYTFEHSRRVAQLSRATARRLRLSADDVELVTMAARVHDVGKIGIKSTVLMNPGTLTDPEWEEMRSHAQVGARLIAHFPQFANGRDLVLHHHERYDGKGYPGRLVGEQIPLGARILAVADAWDAMTSHRAYRKALDPAVVRAEMQRGRGTQFDPAVLDAFLAVLDERPELAAPPAQPPQDVDVPAPAPATPAPLGTGPARPAADYLPLPPARRPAPPLRWISRARGSPEPRQP